MILLQLLVVILNVRVVIILLLALFVKEVIWKIEFLDKYLKEIVHVKMGTMMIPPKSTVKVLNINNIY